MKIPDDFQKALDSADVNALNDGQLACINRARDVRRARQQLAETKGALLKQLEAVERESLQMQGRFDALVTLFQDLGTPGEPVALKVVGEAKP